MRKLNVRQKKLGGGIFGLAVLVVLVWFVMSQQQRAQIVSVRGWALDSTDNSPALGVSITVNGTGFVTQADGYTSESWNLIIKARYTVTVVTVTDTHTSTLVCFGEEGVDNFLLVVVDPTYSIVAVNFVHVDTW